MGDDRVFDLQREAEAAFLRGDFALAEQRFREAIPFVYWNGARVLRERAEDARRAQQQQVTA